MSKGEKIAVMIAAILVALWIYGHYFYKWPTTSSNQTTQTIVPGSTLGTALPEADY